jgi:DNA-binding CsgD family transcriptional regulator
LADLVEADAWMWSCTAVREPPHTDAMSTFVIDGGWKSPAEQGKVFEFVLSPEYAEHGHPRVVRQVLEGTPVTWGSAEALPPDRYEAMMALWRKTGFDPILLSIFPLNRVYTSNLGVYRRLGRPPFGERERVIVHTVFGQLGWLHDYAVQDGSARDTALSLSPRERQTLIFLLAGFSHKEISERLGISRHTVTDYVKSVHEKFGVTSRAQLQAQVFLGRKQPR